MDNTNSKLYLFFTSLMFLFSPLSAGLAFIYFGGYERTAHFEGLVINIGLLAIMILIMFLLRERKLLSLPNKKEAKYLLFGLLSNILIYFYVFQYSLNIQRLMSVYLVVFIILILYFFIIDKKAIIKELWILSVWFLFMDTLHYQSFYRNLQAATMLNSFNKFFLVQLYRSIPLVAFVLYVCNMKKYKVIDTFTLLSIGLASLSTILFFSDLDANSRLILTINLIFPFVIISDFITMLIFKRFNPLKVAFYLRLYTLMVLVMIYSESDYFTKTAASFTHESLYEMVGIIYVAIIANLIVFLFNKKDEPSLIQIEEVDSEEVVKESNITSLDIDLNTLNITTLKALAKAKGIKGYTSLEKDELIDLLK